MRGVFGIGADCARHTAQVRACALAAHEDMIHIDIVFVGVVLEPSKSLVHVLNHLGMAVKGCVSVIKACHEITRFFAKFGGVCLSRFGQTADPSSAVNIDEHSRLFGSIPVLRLVEVEIKPFVALVVSYESRRFDFVRTAETEMVSQPKNSFLA